ncbi:unnamed protein product, partial [Allacma fusca]
MEYLFGRGLISNLGAETNFSHVRDFWNFGTKQKSFNWNRITLLKHSKMKTKTLTPSFESGRSWNPRSSTLAEDNTDNRCEYCKQTFTVAS